MSLSAPTLLCLVGWLFTLHRIRTVHWRNVRRDGGVALNIWLMLFFFSITLTFLGGFGKFLDAHTIDNLSGLIAYPSILATIYLAVRESINMIDKPFDQLGSSLAVTVTALLAIYVFFLWRVPEFTSVPRSLPEAIFRFLTFSFAGMLCVVEAKEYLAYFQLEKITVLRLRALMIILCAISACAFFITRIVQVAGYFLPLLTSVVLNELSIILLILSSLLYFAAFLSDKVYARFAMMSSSIQKWRTLQDLRYLTVRLLRLCPDIGMPAANPSFWRFVFNAEYYLYRVIITIMDGKTMLDDLLLEGALQEPPLWEGDVLQDVIDVKQVLQSINPSGDFWEIVGEYQRASKELVQGQHPIQFLKADQQR